MSASRTEANSQLMATRTTGITTHHAPRKKGSTSSDYREVGQTPAERKAVERARSAMLMTV